MRIIVVEDEPKTREGLLSVIGKYTAHEVLFAARDGAAGLEKIRELRPDLIISDIRMPGMDGLTMLRKLTDEGVPYEAILLTGYSEFEYARKAIQLEVAEYILKPLDVGELLSALGKVEQKLQKQERAEVTVGQLVFSLLTSPREEKDDLLALLRERVRIDPRETADLFLLGPAGADAETTTEIQRRLEQSLDSLHMGAHYVCRLPGDMGVLAILLDTGGSLSAKSMFRSRVLPGIHKVGPCFCLYGDIRGVAELEERIRMLQSLLQYAFSLDQSEIIDREAVEGLTFTRLSYPEELENAIGREIRSGNTVRLREIGERFRERVIDSGATPGHIREYTARFASKILAAVAEWGGRAAWDEDRLDFHDMVRSMTDSRSKAELSAYFSRVLELAAGEQETAPETDNSTVIKVISFIRSNFHRDITLTDAAELVGLTPEYLSKLFNQEMDVNFVVFLRNFRISTAKRLLAEGGHKIAEVAEAVGFHDVKYFNKVFKTVTGVSPSEYKKGIS